MKPGQAISVVIVNYNSSNHIYELLESLIKITAVNWEILVVDNASPDDQVDWLKRSFPDIRIIYAPENKGFAAGNNLGIGHASGEYILLLNPDTVVTPGFIFPLIECFEKDPKVGLASPKIKYYNEPEIIQYAGYSKISPFTLRSTAYGDNKQDQGQFNQSFYTAYGHGAAMIVRRSILAVTGLMDEAYFLYYEEMDWCHRIRKSGFKIRYVAASLVYHKESQSVKPSSPLKVYYMTRNRMLFARKNLPFWRLAVSLLFMLFVSLPVNIARHFKSKPHLRAYLKGFFGGITEKKG